VGPSACSRVLHFGAVAEYGPEVAMPPAVSSRYY